MIKYFTNCTVADEDWKTQMAQGYPDIPANEEVEMVQREYINYYGKWCIIRWNGHIYYTLKRNIREEEGELKL